MARLLMTIGLMLILVCGNSCSDSGDNLIPEIDNSSITEIDNSEEDYRAASRAIGGAFAVEALSRQPEIFDKLLNMADMAAIDARGDGDQSAAAKFYAYHNMYDTIARNPEVFDNAKTMTEYAIGTTIQKDPLFRSELAEIERLKGLRSVWAGIARQPEASNKILVAALLFSGPPKSADIRTSAEDRARMQSLGKVWDDDPDYTTGNIGLGIFDAVARQPEAAAKLMESAIALVGYPKEVLSVETQKARYLSLSGLYEAIARQPEALETLQSTAIQLFGDNHENRSEESEAARMKSFTTLYESIARQPEKAQDLLDSAVMFTGPVPTQMTEETAAARMKSFSALFAAVARQPEATDDLILVAKTLTGDLDYTGKTPPPLVQQARLEALGGFYEALARQPEAYLAFERILLELLGYDIDLSDDEHEE